VRESTQAEKPELVLIAKLAHPGLSLFAIDMGEENSYTPAAPQGVTSQQSSLKTEQLATAISRKTKAITILCCSFGKPNLRLLGTGTQTPSPSPAPAGE
jgi:hypothetical protein